MLQDRNSEENCNDLVLNEELKEKHLEVRGQNIGGDQGASYNHLSNSGNKEALETCDIIDSPAQVECLAMVEIIENWKLKLMNQDCTKISHLDSEQPLEASQATAVGTPHSANKNTDLIMLGGCACKDELGIARSHCAEAWFKIKGNK
ncbi:hypothetical protein MTR_8g086580 [Medicago truncatula]|uniref:RING/FYVE/PHD zinc finger protein n=1 Tax=Medicago truncatula TaxID=3880 RepID=G7LJG2_MEDTR|nr:hypothetical protein MTR_8g086580 [Medicago truncatula]